MITNFNDVISLIVMIVIVLGALTIFVGILFPQLNNKSLKDIFFEFKNYSNNEDE